MAAKETTCGLSGNSPQVMLWHRLRTLNLRVQGRLSDRLAASLELSLPEFEILLQLFDAPERRQRMSALAECVGLSRSRLTHTVRRLEAKGLVSRFTCDSDKRGVHCRLTELGEDTVNDFAAEHSAHVQRELASEDSAKDLEEIARLMPKILR